MKGREQKMEKCSHIYRVSTHPSIKVGGSSIGQCTNECLPGFTVCFEHVTKDALSMMLKIAMSRIDEMEKKLADVAELLQLKG